MTLYKAATGEVPFTHTDWFELARMHVEDPPPPLRKRRSDLSKRFERVVFKCLAKHPDDRYQSAGQLTADLGEIDAKPRATGKIGVPPPPWGLVAALGVGLVVLVALVVKLMR